MSSHQSLVEQAAYWCRQAIQGPDKYHLPNVSFLQTSNTPFKLLLCPKQSHGSRKPTASLGILSGVLISNIRSSVGHNELKNTRYC